MTAQTGGVPYLDVSLIYMAQLITTLDFRSTVKICSSKFIHISCIKTGNSMYQNNCTVIRYNVIQTLGGPSTSSGIFRPSSRRYSTKKNTIMAGCVIVKYICDIIDQYCIFLSRVLPADGRKV
jgi:hypothetical protein